MVFSKIKKISFILLILFILLFPFWCVKGFCAENVELLRASGIAAPENSNVFISDSATAVRYFYAEKGYKYIINVNQSFVQSRIVVASSEQPALNVVYNLLYTSLITEGTQFIYSPINDCYISISVDFPDGYISVTKEPLDNQSSAINSLVENVGISSIWNIFDISINYIVVVVLFAFGCYIIFKIIKKITRGKEGL